MTTKPIRRLPPMATILPLEIANALRAAWLEHDRDLIAQITAQAKKTHPEFWRDEEAEALKRGALK